MIIIENTCLSDDIIDQHFVCDLKKCKGACCVEGDSGAPLEIEELPILEDIYEKVAPYLPEVAKKVIAEKGLYEVDEEGDFCTTTIQNRECVFAYYDENQTLGCAIEKAYKEGKINFQKPVSCHLYPIRVTKTKELLLANYHRWDICKEACTLGTKLQVPLYKFLKEPLIRKFGDKWYRELEQIVNT